MVRGLTIRQFVDKLSLYNPDMLLEFEIQKDVHIAPWKQRAVLVDLLGGTYKPKTVTICLED